MRSTGIRLAPAVRGIAGLTSAMTVRAVWAAAFVTSTEIPRLQVPSGSGGATWIIATSRGSCPLRKSPGTSPSASGMYSTQPDSLRMRASRPT